VPLSLLLISILIPGIYWFNENLDELTGIIELNIKPVFNGVVPKNKMIVAIHVLKETSNVSERVFIGKVNVPFKYRLKVKRIPVGLTQTHRVVMEGGKFKTIVEENPLFKEVTIAVFILDPEYFGSKVLFIEPKKRITQVNVIIELCKTKKAKSTSLHKPHTLNSIRTYTEVDEKKVWLKAGEVHSIDGLSVKWCIGRNGALYFESYGREMVSLIEPGDLYDSGWYSNGKKETKSSIGIEVGVSDGVKKIVEAYVLYRCEYWWYVDSFSGVTYDYFWAYPVWFDSIRLGSSISCITCDSEHPWYAGEVSDATYFEIPFAKSDSDEKWLFTRVDISFWFSIGEIKFGATISLYRAAGSNTREPPYLKVYINEWKNDILYWWYDNNDDKRYEAHFSWE